MSEIQLPKPKRDDLTAIADALERIATVLEQNSTPWNEHAVRNYSSGSLGGRNSVEQEQTR